jgi:hypothetical protein
VKELAEYKTPRASVRGVFLCENVADTVAVSALTAKDLLQRRTAVRLCQRWRGRRTAVRLYGRGRRWPGGPYFNNRGPTACG